MEPPATLDAMRFRHVLRTAERWLERNREAVNAINVYPVPDGDTGTNMVLTLRAALDACEQVEGPAVGPYLEAAARGALLGARGNSGVILSQILRGLAEPLLEAQEVDATLLREGLTAAATSAYGAVVEPVEGTMLTVMREAAETAAATGSEASLGDVLDAAVAESVESLERTPTLLPRLAEAGVVDAGGMGVAVLLAGMRYGYLGEEFPEPVAVPAGAIEMTGVEHEGHGYCTEFVVTGSGLDRESLHATIEAAGGESLIVAGYEDALHIHVHMEDPGPAISAGAAVGDLANVKVENMQAQHDEWASAHEDMAIEELPSLGLVAVSQGRGIAAAFRELGATQVVDGGPTANPSAGELLGAARKAGRDHVFLLPNDPNVTMAAEQAAAEEPGLVTVIPTRSVAAGFGAAIAYAPDGDAEAVAGGMREAIEGVRCVSVTRSVRDTSADGIAVADGDAIVLVDGTLVARADSLEEALLAGLGRVAEGAELATLYLGADAPADAEERVSSLIAEAHAGLELEVVPGGQPHYPYILGVE